MAYTIFEKEGYIHVAWSGVISEADLASLRKEMPKRVLKYMFSRRLLHTFDEVTTCALKPMELLDHSIKRKKLPIPFRSKSASVAKTETVYKFARLVQELNRNPMLDMQIFDSDEEALKWLFE